MGSRALVRSGVRWGSGDKAPEALRILQIWGLEKMEDRPNTLFTPVLFPIVMYQVKPYRLFLLLAMIVDRGRTGR